MQLMLMIFIHFLYVCILAHAQLRDEHVDDVSLRTLHIHTYIHRYDDFLIAVISVGLGLAHVNHIHCTYL